MARFLSKLALAGLVLLTGVLPLHAADQVTLTWTAGGAGGGWYSMAGGIATVINQASPDIVIKVIPGGGLQNPALVAEKSAEIGWGLPFMNAAAYKGIAPFERPLTELRALAGGMSMNFFHLYVGAELPVDDMDQLFARDKFRLALSQAGSSEAWVFEQILAAYGTNFKAMSDKGFHFARGNYAFQSNQFKDKNADGVFTFLALPGAAVTEASVGRDLKLVHFSDKALKYLDQFGITAGEIPLGTYPKAANTATVRTAKSGSVITVHKDMPEDLAYRITKIFNENLDKVHQIHASLAPYEVKDGPTGCGVPLHPGAERYYREAGVLK
jgi:hypothetical protein